MGVCFTRARRSTRFFGSAVFASVVFAASAAHADLKMKWDCYLPSTSVDCAVLQSSLTSKIPFLKAVHEKGDADVVVTLTSVPAENATRFNFVLEGKAVDGYRTKVQTTDKIPWSIDSATTNVRIMTKLERGLDDFMDQKFASEVKDGKLDIVVVDPVQLPFQGRPEQSSVKWYLAPIASAYFSDIEGVGVNAAASIALSFNYSESAWRLQQQISANYSQQSQPVPGTNETASINFEGGNATNVISHDLTNDHKWSIGLLLSGEKNPQANYRMRANASVGAEFDLVPRQTVNQKNLGGRCAVGPEYENYDATNIEGLNEQLVVREFCDVFFSWHFTPVDVSAGIGETVVLKSIEDRAFSASLSATWRVTDNFTISPWVSAQQINQAINEAAPTSTVFTDPRLEIQASMLSAVQQGYTAPFGVQSGFSVRYTLGNGSLSSEDQRWKGASNLR